MPIRTLLLHDPVCAHPGPGAVVPDVVVLDLTAGLRSDVRAIDELGLGRGSAAGSLGSVPSPYHGRTGGPGLYVKVSPLSSESIAGELLWALTAGANGIVLPGALGVADIERLGAKLAVVEAELGAAEGATRILAIGGDTPAGTLALSSFRRTSRLVGLACDPAALAAAIGCDLRAPAVTQSGALVVLAAAACGIEAVLVATTSRATQAAERAGFGAVLAPAGRLTRAWAGASRTSSRVSRRSSRDSRPA